MFVRQRLWVHGSVMCDGVGGGGVCVQACVCAWGRTVVLAHTPSKNCLVSLPNCSTENAYGCNGMHRHPTVHKCTQEVRTRLFAVLEYRRNERCRYSAILHGALVLVGVENHEVKRQYVLVP